MKAPDRGWPEPADYYVRKGEKKIVGRPAFGSIKYFMEPPPSLGASYVTNGKVYSLLISVVVYTLTMDLFWESRLPRHSQ